MKLFSRKNFKTVLVVLPASCWVITLLIIVWVLFSYLLPQDLTKTTEPYATLVVVSFFGRVLTFQLSLFLILFALVSVVMRRRWLLTTAGISSVILLSPTLLSLFPIALPVSVGPTLRLMSMNLKYTHRDGDLIARQIQKYSPDVLVLEDYTPFAQAVLDNALVHDYPHRYLVFNWLQGLAIYSRLPFDGGRPRTTFTKTRRQMRAVVTFNNHPIVIYIEHPFSPRSRQRILNNRLSTVDLANQIRAEKFPVIVAGDFNFTSETPNETELKSTGLQDTFELVGHGRGSTWPVEPRWRQWLPGVRIDHIFVSPQLTCREFRVGDYDGSDHLPILADVAASVAR